MFTGGAFNRIYCYLKAVNQSRDHNFILTQVYIIVYIARFTDRWGSKLWVMVSYGILMFRRYWAHENNGVWYQEDSQKRASQVAKKEEQTYGISLFNAMKTDKPRQKKKQSQYKKV